MALQNGLFEVLVRPEWAFKCGRFARSFGPSGEIDRPDEANGTNEIRPEDECGKIACKPFSNSLIVHAICVVGS